MGYTHELINFLANDDNNEEFSHSCSNDHSDFQNFTYHNNTFDEPHHHNSNYNPLNTPNSMLYSSSSCSSSSTNQNNNNKNFLNSKNFYNSLEDSTTNHLNNNNSMDIPPSSNENQYRCDDGFSSLSVDSTISSSSAGGCFLMSHSQKQNPLLDSNSAFQSDSSYNRNCEQQQKTSIIDKGFCNNKNLEVNFLTIF